METSPNAHVKADRVAARAGELRRATRGWRRSRSRWAAARSRSTSGRAARRPPAERKAVLDTFAAATDNWTRSALDRRGDRAGAGVRRRRARATRVRQALTDFVAGVVPAAAAGRCRPAARRGRRRRPAGGAAQGSRRPRGRADGGRNDRAWTRRRRRRCRSCSTIPRRRRPRCRSSRTGTRQGALARSADARRPRCCCASSATPTTSDDRRADARRQPARRAAASRRRRWPTIAPMLDRRRGAGAAQEPAGRDAGRERRRATSMRC